MFRGCAHAGGGTLAALVLTSTNSRTIAARPFLRAASISPVVLPKAPRFKRCAAVSSFHFCIGNGTSTLIFTPVMFEPPEGRRQIDAAECFRRTKSYACPAIRDRAPRQSAFG